jgi:hypothetical protein
MRPMLKRGGVRTTDLGGLAPTTIGTPVRKSGGTTDTAETESASRCSTTEASSISERGNARGSNNNGTVIDSPEEPL